MVPLIWAEGGEVVQVGGNIFGVGLKVRYVGRLGKGLVPGANVLANIAAGDPVVEIVGDRWGKLRISILDSVIGDAAIGVHHKGLGDRLGGASV